MAYTVYCENLPTASAWAQKVYIVDNLDPNLDIRTFRLGQIGFNQTVVEVPANRSFFQTRVTRPEQGTNIVVDISAGVDLDPLDFSAGHALNLRFETKIQRLQAVGMLILCSFGDRIPIRLGMPANRPNRLYAYTRTQWEPVADFATNQWHSLAVTVRSADFSVTADHSPSKTFPNPLVNPTPRLYLGDGFEVDYLNSNSGSEFLVDLQSLKTGNIP